MNLRVMSNSSTSTEKSTKKIQLYSPVAGHLIHLEKVNDDVFSQKMLGDGFAVRPTETEIFAPIGGKVATLMEESKHAIIIKSTDGAEMLVHMGLDTVTLKGKPFEIKVSLGDTVEPGQEIATMNLDKIKETHKDPTVIVTATNMDKVAEVSDFEEKTVEPGESVMSMLIK